MGTYTLIARAAARNVIPQRAAQVAWLLFAVLCVSLILAGVLPHTQRAIVACEGANCLAMQPTLVQAVVAQEQGMAQTTADGRQSTATVLFAATLCMLTAAFCIARRPGDPAAVAAAWGLAALSAGEFVRALAQEQPALHGAVHLLALIALLGLTYSLCSLTGGNLQPRGAGWAVVGLAILGVLSGLGAAPPAALGVLGIAAATFCAFSLAVQHRMTAGLPQHERVTWGIAALMLVVGAQFVGKPLRLLPLETNLTTLLPPQAFTFASVNGLVLAVAAVACLAVALLRDELFDVDLIVNRALVYGLLSIMALAAYVLVVGYLSLLFQGSGSRWFALVATGAVAALVAPLYTRVQRLVNRMLYGQRAEPYTVIAEIGRQLEASLPPEDVLPAVAETVAAALRLSYVAIVLGHNGTETAVAVQGRPQERAAIVGFPLIHQGVTVGQLLAAPREGEAELGGDDRRLLGDLARQAGVAAHAMQLTNELRRSREQLVTAREEERRRLRRDLHDGLGPTLASQALTIDTVELLLARDPAAASALLHEVKAQSQAAIADIRRVVYGLRPPALDDLGLVGALREQASRYAGARIDVQVVAPTALPALPAAVEVAVYHIAQEALANVAHHAQACRCTLKLAVGDTLTLTVTDNGVGFAEDRAAGVGLRSMRERAEELGGALRIKSMVGGGTTIRATLPLSGGGA